MPASFVDEQVQFVATATALEEDLAGVGSSDADLQSYFSSTSREFDTACFTAARVLQSRPRRRTAAAQVAFGTPFAHGGGDRPAGRCAGCAVLADRGPQLPVERQTRQPGHGRRVAPPISVNGSTTSSQIDEADARRPYSAGQGGGVRAPCSKGGDGDAEGAHRGERHGHGERQPAVRDLGAARRSCSPPLTPEPSDVLNRVGRTRRRRRLGGLGGQPVQRLSVAQRRPHVTVVGLGPAGTDLSRTRGGLDLLARRGAAYLRTARHPAAAGLDGARAFDDLYESAATFDEVYGGDRGGAGRGGRGRGARARGLRRARLAAGGRAHRRAAARRRPGRGQRSSRPSPSSTWPGPRSGIDPLAEGVRLVDAVAFGPSRPTRTGRSWWRSAGPATCSPR